MQGNARTRTSLVGKQGRIVQSQGAWHVVCTFEDNSQVKLQTSALYVHGPSGADLRARMAAAERR